MSVSRVSTGIPGLDRLIEGGFPTESLVLLVGPPGAGKSTLAAQYLYMGARKYGAVGAYICFAETKKTFLRNMLTFGWDFNQLEKEGKVSFLDLSTTQEEGLQDNINKILEIVTTLNVNRLVIDSSTALFMALKDPIGARVLLHLLYKFLKEKNCVSLMIVDKPWGSESFGRGGAEFIVDGTILLETFYDKKTTLRRRLKILKMRGTNHTKKVHEYHIDKDGFKIVWTTKQKSSTKKRPKKP